MGPLQMSDLAGNDIGWNIRKDFGWEAEMASRGERYHGALADLICDAGRFGQKTTKGWYDYSAGRAPVDDPEVEKMILEHSARAGFTRRAIEPAEVLDRCLLPLVNEGFKILEEGIAQRESDIDVTYLYGYGFPRYQGGPMYWARNVRSGGLPKLAADMAQYAAAHPTTPHWKPAELLLKEAAKAKL
jgi:3-hydroxyacyl-CoA dehydrogenase